MHRFRFSLSARLLLVALLVLAAAVPAMAEEAENADAAPAGYLADFLKDFDGASKKLNDLADAMSDEQFAYTPSEEVRNFGQVLVHVAGANFFLSRALGIDPPEGLGQDLESTHTTKAEIMKLLADSQEQVRQAATAHQDVDLDQEIDLFGGKRTLRGVFMVIAGHSHEHLGQSIAYARGAGVAPPWSQGG